MYVGEFSRHSRSTVLVAKFAGSRNVTFARFFRDISLWLANFARKRKILQYLANTLRYETLRALRETVREFRALILHGNGDPL